MTTPPKDHAPDFDPKRDLHLSLHPAEVSFMRAIAFEGTRYHAVARRTEEQHRSYAYMGFTPGFTPAADQPVTLARSL